MKALRAIGMAFALYSRIPMPNLDWESESRRWLLCAFPLVGIAVGGAELLWLWLARLLGLSGVLQAAVLTAIPLLVTGGIHLDGFCDVCDAQASHQSRERKLEIMKDPHVGSFAVMACVLYLLLTFGLWHQLDRTDSRLWAALLLLPVLGRCLSAYAALTLPNARGNGMLASVTAPERGQLWILAAAAIFCSLGILAARWMNWIAVAGGGLTYLGYVRRVRREFGGTTGDLSGWFLQRFEWITLAGLVLAQGLEECL